MGCFRAPPPWWKMAPFKNKPIKRSINTISHHPFRPRNPLSPILSVSNLQPGSVYPHTSGSPYLRPKTQTSASQKYWDNMLRMKLHCGAPCPSFPCFFWKMARKTTKKTRIFNPYRTPKSLEKSEKRSKNQGIPCRAKNKEFQKNKERKDRALE